MQSKASTVAEYLKSLEPERRKAINAIRKVIKDNLDPKIKEVMSYGMIGWVVPLTVYPEGYHCNPSTPLPFANLASQKNSISIYLFCVYGDEAEKDRLAKNWKATGKKLDMGKSCIRVKTLDDVPLDVLGDAVKRITLKHFVDQYEAALEGTAAGKKRAALKVRAEKKASKKPAAKKAAAKKPASKKTASKKTASKKVTKKASTKKKATKKAATRRRTS